MFSITNFMPPITLQSYGWYCSTIRVQNMRRLVKGWVLDVAWEPCTWEAITIQKSKFGNLTAKSTV